MENSGADFLPQRDSHAGTNLEQQTARVYQDYFGPSWRQELTRSLLAEVRVATPDDTRRVGPQRGWTETVAEATTGENRIIKNHIVVHQLPSSEMGDFALRTEIGEALYNLIENAAVTGRIPMSEGKPPEGFAGLISSSPESEIAAFCREILDSWNAAYQEKPRDRYAGMNADSPREYRNIPEWKSEGFSDGVAIEIRRKSGMPLSPREAKAWSGFAPQAKNLIQVATDQFVPQVVTRY